MWSLAVLYIGTIIVPCICQRFKMFNQIPWAYNICQWYKLFLSLFWLRSVARNWSMLMIGSVSTRFPWTHEAQILHFFIRNEQVIIHHWNLTAVTLNNFEIKREISVTFLGVIIDENVSWKLYIALIPNEMSKNITILYRA